MVALTVLLPVHNGEKWIAACLEALLSQTFTDFDVVIVDDGSDDATPQIARRYVSLDRRVRVVRQAKASSLGEVLNSQLPSVDTEWVARMDVDDLARPLLFERTLTFLRNNVSVDIVGTHASVIDRESRRWLGDRRPASLHTDLMVDLLFSNPIIHPSITVRTDALRALGGYRPLPYVEDYELWTRAIKEGLKLATIDEVLIDCGHHDMQVTRKYRPQVVERALEVNQKYAAWLFRDLDEGASEDARRWSASAFRLGLGQPLEPRDLQVLKRVSGWMQTSEELPAELRPRIRHHARRIAGRFVEPSSGGHFEVAQTDYASMLSRRVGGYERGVPLWINDTVRIWEFGAALDLPVPLNGQTVSRERLSPQNLPRTGGFLTTRTRSNYGDLVPIPPVGVPERKSRVLATFDSVFKRYNVDSDVVVGSLNEDLSDPCYIYRVFACAGEIACVLAESRSEDLWNASLWRGGFVEGAEVRFRSPAPERRTEIIRVPKFAGELIYYARLISLALPTAFVRLDFIPVGDAPVLLGAQLFPRQFTEAHALQGDSRLLDEVSTLWLEAQRWISHKDLVPAAKFDPRALRFDGC